MAFYHFSISSRFPCFSRSRFFRVQVQGLVQVLEVTLSIDTYITNTEEENKLRKTGIFFESLLKMFIWNYCQNSSKCNCEGVNLYKFKHIIFILPGIKQGAPVSSSAISTDPGSHNSELTESFSTPRFLGVKASDNDFGLC